MRLEHTEVAIRPDGEEAVTVGGDNTLRLWNVKTGRLLAVLEGHQGSLFGVSYNSDGKRIATASADNTVRVWDADMRGTRGRIGGYGADVGRRIQCRWQASCHRLRGPHRKHLARVSDDASAGRLCKEHCAALPHRGPAPAGFPGTEAADVVHCGEEVALPRCQIGHGTNLIA